MFYTRINKIKKLKQGSSGKMHIYIYTEPFYGNRYENAPTFSSLISLTAGQRKQRLLEAVRTEMSKFIQSYNLEIDEVKDNQTLLFGKSGSVIFKNEQIPDKLSIYLWMIEADSNMNNFIPDTDSISDSDIFKKLYSTVETGLTATDSVENKTVALENTVLQLLRNNLKAGKIDLLDYWHSTFSRAEHYPHGLYNIRSVSGVAENILIDCTLFGFENEMPLSPAIIGNTSPQPLSSPLNAPFSPWKGATGGEEEFIRQIYPLAKHLHENRDGIHPLFVTAQAAFEAGWKTKTPGNNIFGITKGMSWTGEVNLLPTIEIFNTPEKTYASPEKIVSIEQIAPNKYRYRVYRQFRAYTSLENSLEDHLSLLKTSPYCKAWPSKHDPREYARQIAGMYAENPDYAKTLIALIDFIETKIKTYKL
jgi:flagellar protein FlgJ